MRVEKGIKQQVISSPYTLVKFTKREVEEIILNHVTERGYIPLDFQVVCTADIRGVQNLRGVEEEVEADLAYIEVEVSEE